MEALSKYRQVNLPTIIIEHIHKVLKAKDRKHGLAYGFWLNWVFAYFDIKCGPRKDGLVKQIFIVSTLEDNEYIPKRSGVKSKLVVVDLIEAQTKLISDLEDMTALVAQKNAENTNLKAVNLKGHEGGSGW